MHTYICLYREVCLSSRGFCLEGFVRGRFCPSPPLSEYIRYNIKLNITFNFRFHIYEKKIEKCDVTCSWTPSSLSQIVTPYRTPSPKLDVLYGRPLTVHWTSHQRERVREGREEGREGGRSLYKYSIIRPTLLCMIWRLKTCPGSLDLTNWGSMISVIWAMHLSEVVAIL